MVSHRQTPVKPCYHYLLGRVSLFLSLLNFLHIGRHTTPTVSLDIIALVASSCRYYRGHIEQRAAQSFAVYLATQRGLAKRRQHRHPPLAQPVAPMRERHCSRPRLPPRRGTAQAPSRAQGHPGGAHGKETTPLPHHGIVKLLTLLPDL